MRLSQASLPALAAGVERFGYDREQQATGIVHFGIGAFHRAHQAYYTDRAMDGGDRDWAIAGISLRSADVADQLLPQDGLYSVTERSGSGERLRLIGAVRDVVHAPARPGHVTALLAAPTTHIASFTITEKGYCRAADGTLDATLAGAGSIYAWLAAGLRQRHDAGLGGLTLLSCDNLADNGPQLRQLLDSYLDRHDPALAAWVARECRFPATMVDRIVPATTEADRKAVAAALGLEDAGAVVTEPFSQWVIEDDFAGPRPRWDMAGAQLVRDVVPYETAKLRMLNGAHSALAYLGLERGHAHVHEAIADPVLRPIIETLMRVEAATSFDPAAGQNLDAYADALLERFANPALRHRLEQIAMDGSQKIPQRWLAPLAAQQAAGRDCPALLGALAAWMRHVRGEHRPVDDPRAGELRHAWDRAGTAGIVDALFGPSGLVASPWRPDAATRERLTGMLERALSA